MRRSGVGALLASGTAGLLSVAAAAAPARPAPPWSSHPIVLDLDAREAPHRLLHAHLVVPVVPGPLTLVYPKWLPGEHGPTGPIADLAGLRFTAGGRAVAWRRDPVDLYAFHLDVPPATSSLEVALDLLSPPETSGFSSGASTTTQLAVLSWNQVLLFPKGESSDRLNYTASLQLPAGWKHGTALPVRREAAGEIDFATVSLTTLVDSPVLVGAHLRTFPLTDDPPTVLHAAADSEAALEAPPALVEGWKRLVAETDALFGAHHYRSYSFLLTLSDHTAHFGLEHHESSDDRVAERSLVDDGLRRRAAGLLPHEMTHSWNGKYRRPAGLAPGSFETPMQGELLWVYEGLTTYLGQVLAARSGLLTPDEYRDSLALTAASMDRQGGRKWRPLADTAVAAQVLYDSRSDRAAWRRGVDFYPEGELLWLEADTIIRRKTKGARSLDDFCRRFFGPPSGPPQVVPYGFDDVVEALQQVTPYDWRGFWRAHLEATDPRAPLGGITGGGWTLTYAATAPTIVQSIEGANHSVDARFSLGLDLRDDGQVKDVIPDSPADRAGVAPGVKLVAVNGRRFSRDGLRDAIRATKAPKQPIELLEENGEFFSAHRLDYDGGERYPRLEAEPGAADLLSAIIQPHAAAAPAR